MQHGVAGHDAAYDHMKKFGVDELKQPSPQPQEQPQPQQHPPNAASLESTTAASGTKDGQVGKGGLIGTANATPTPTGSDLEQA